MFACELFHVEARLPEQLQIVGFDDHGEIGFVIRAEIDVGPALIGARCNDLAFDGLERADAPIKLLGRAQRKSAIAPVAIARTTGLILGRQELADAGNARTIR